MPTPSRKKWSPKKPPEEVYVEVKVTLALPQSKAKAMVQNINDILAHVAPDDLALLAQAVKKPLLRNAAISELRNRLG